MNFQTDMQTDLTNHIKANVAELMSREFMNQGFMYLAKYFQQYSNQVDDNHNNYTLQVNKIYDNHDNPPIKPNKVSKSSKTRPDGCCAVM